MHKFPFKAQLIAAIIILALCFILSVVTHSGVFQNIAWVSIGLLWVFNPVWPESLNPADDIKTRNCVFAAGAVIVLLGLITRFGGY